MTTRDIENQYNNIDIVSDASDPLLPSKPRSTKSDRRMHRSLEVVELDDIPPIIKSANGNIFWADQQCTRRIGLTSTEARLFLKLLQTDEPENLNYDEYKNMFDGFGREQKTLQELVDSLPWWRPNTWSQRKIWQARIDWLQRMDEPRLWLLYLMARRKRILKTALVRVISRLKEKRQERVESQESPTRGRNPGAAIKSMMLSDATQTSQSPTNTAVPDPKSVACKRPGPVVIESRVTESQQCLATRLRNSISLTPLSTQLRSHSDSRFKSSQTCCPVFSQHWKATRGDIKKQVEVIMGAQKPYLVIGWFLRSALHPQEKILQFDNPEDLFVALRKGERSLRGFKRFLSLKGLRGFGLYKCDISRGAHIPLLLTPSQSAILAQFYLAYRASYRHPDPDVAIAWQGWVARNLNASPPSGSSVEKPNGPNPLEGRYSLQLEYEWSSYRLIAVVMIPLILSIAIGVWYMQLEEGDVVTAWTLALYVITAAALLIALMTVVGGLKDV